MEKLNTSNLLKLNQVDQKASASVKKTSDSNDFSKLLKKSIDELNQAQESSDKALVDMATGQIKDLHQAAIAIGRAETSMKLMLEVRNKAISAYKEILRTQV
ncbi:flagellar hook-basal body complex protein FliE [Helicobacter mustelae]|uniref:Flagellar hook-basal body complex protein FliE n=1 Tax=Helicobacter mustelae (strain ATCC 43772 / CCUG 25715 / CIP 103759 / LMG 18044 / NCTC 12198 / R85-136P) TaxID=679897 RepID=D3UJ24_HELM1|nr:flagellar hook-basal body complex protein FliE [Helicobacter mustelae]CBG40499.1 putative flagellar hook-basal body complex protein [Helicobacter mustelae 12198]SQH71998.1 flagellar hook-basal body complex protein [Helicobacter mustelae]STP13141.1 flagellar hook-basal body complex protein [Helicobacter mustelae]